MTKEQRVKHYEKKSKEELIRIAVDFADATESLLEWVDAVPDEVQLPAMPGVSRDWVEQVLSE